jgi:hypothetical protein
MPYCDLLKAKIIKKYDYMEQLEWKTEKRKVNDLLPFEINPRKISDEKRQQLIRSLEKFNLAEIPAINKDGIVISGNQRIKALQMIGRGEELIDVRVPNRQLTEAEVKEYNLISNTHAGEWDFEMLELEFSDINLNDFNIEGLDDWKAKQESALVSEASTKDLSERIESKFMIEVICVSESEQEQLYNELTKKGYQCRLLTL